MTAQKKMFLIRLASPWSKRIEGEDYRFDVNIPAEEADAFLAEYMPVEELFTFPGKKAWYCCEPNIKFQGKFTGEWPKLRANLPESEFLCHNHTQPELRVPHITHDGRGLSMKAGNHPRSGAISVVSNYGGPPWNQTKNIRVRNRFVTHSRVHLFGRKGWSRYRSSLFSRPRTPGNYQGELPGDWPSGQKRELMTKYQVCVCLENSFQPHYFTEKFVESVVAGCVPIYCAHPTIKDTVLAGARWIDPQDFNFKVDDTFDAAFDANAQEIREANAQWLLSNPHLAATSQPAVFQRIAQILRATADK